jgi:hypothetical protein
MSIVSKYFFFLDSDLEKRHKVDHLSHDSCRYIKKNGYCKYSRIKNKLCHITCGKYIQALVYQYDHNGT